MRPGRMATRLLLLSALGLALTATPALAKTKTVTKTFSSGTLTTPLVDNRLVAQAITVPKKERGTVKDVDALVRLNHTRDSDIFVALIGPQPGRFANLTTDNGGSGQDFGSGANDCSGTSTTFDDAAATAITGLGTPAAPFAGSFKPQEPLSIFNGVQTTAAKTTKGVWWFVVGDDDVNETGTLGCVQLKITYAKVVKKK